MKLFEITNRLQFATYFAKDVKDKRKLMSQQMYVTDPDVASAMYDMIYAASANPNSTYIVTTAKQGQHYIGIVTLEFSVSKLPVTRGRGNIFVKQRYRSKGIAKQLLQHAEQKILQIFGDDVRITGAADFVAVAARSFVTLQTRDYFWQPE